MKKSLIFILLLFIILCSTALYAKRWYDSAIYDSILGQDKELVVTNEEGFLDVAKRLESDGFIKSYNAVRLFLKLENMDPQIKFGDYIIPEGSNVPEIIQILENGVYKPGIDVTIKEGLRYQQVADVLETALVGSAFNKAEFLSICENPDNYIFSDEIQTFLDMNKPTGLSLEGLLYPDTYEFASDYSSQQVVEKILSNFIAKINENLQLDSLNLQQADVTSLYEALTLASIIEKEASKTDDRAEISGIFHNRLFNDMTLDSDATVNYFTGKNDAGVLFEDRDTPNEYNTYLNLGLPPTPICNPRIESIKAAFYPNETDYFYFLHDTEGITRFAKTMDEHQENVNEYLN